MKLLKLKQWLTIKETTNYLSTLFNEKVKVRDIYRLALDNHLILSLHFINATNVEIASHFKQGCPKTVKHDLIHLTDKTTIYFEQQFCTMIKNESCTDLVNIFGGKLMLRQRYYKESQLKIEHRVNSSIIFTLPSEPNAYYRLANPCNYDNALVSLSNIKLLPDDIKLVIRTSYLMDFINKVNNKDSEKLNNLHAKERTSLHQLIAILATIAKLPIEHHYKTADLITEIAPTLNIAPLSRGTISKYLKEASHYLS